MDYIIVIHKVRHQILLIPSIMVIFMTWVSSQNLETYNVITASVAVASLGLPSILRCPWQRTSDEVRRLKAEGHLAFLLVSTLNTWHWTPQYCISYARIHKVRAKEKEDRVDVTISRRDRNREPGIGGEEVHFSLQIFQRCFKLLRHCRHPYHGACLNALVLFLLSENIQGGWEWEGRLNLCLHITTR